MNFEKALNVLGLTVGYTGDDLKKAYRKCAKESHPDLQNGSNDKFKLVKESYEFLKENGQPSQRSVFNRQTGRFVYHGEDLFNYVVK